MEEEFIRSASGDETVVDDKEATIRNLLREIERLRASFNDRLARRDAEIERLEAEIERLRAAIAAPMKETWAKAAAATASQTPDAFVEAIRDREQPAEEKLTDIAARLREGIDPLDIPEAERAMDKGADEIERLRAEIERIRWHVDNDHYDNTPDSDKDWGS